MRTVVVIRSCPDYKCLNKDNFSSQIGTPFVPSTEIKEMIDYNVLDLWEECFKLNYFEYRDEISAISKMSLERTECEIIYGYQEFDKWFSHEEEVMVVPIDDDDWLSPEINQLSNHVDETKDLVLWNNVILHSITKCQFGHEDGIYFGSNNWAIRKSALKKLGLKEARNVVLGSHKKSEKLIKQEMDKKHWAFVPKQELLSVYNRHIASLNFIRTQIDKTNFQRELPKISKRPVVACEIPNGLEWSSDLFKKLVRLNVRLREGSVFLI